MLVPLRPDALQQTLSAASSGLAGAAVLPHHPITCTSELRYEDDGRLACPHHTAPADDLRTRRCLDHSVALLLIELAQAL